MDEARAAVAAVLTADVDADRADPLHDRRDERRRPAAADWRPGDRAVTTTGRAPGRPRAAVRAARPARASTSSSSTSATAATTSGRWRPSSRASTPGTRARLGLARARGRPARSCRSPGSPSWPTPRGALVVVDGAQAVGAIPVDVRRARAPTSTPCPARSGCSARRGSGALWSSPDVARPGSPDARRLLQLRARSTARGDAVPWPTPAGSRRPASTARRSSGMARSIGWLSMFVGLDWVYGAVDRAGAGPRPTRLAAIPGVERPDAARTGWPTLVTFRIAGWPAQAAARRARAPGSSPSPERSPASTPSGSASGFFNSEEELERFAAAVELLAAHTPETLPPRRTLAILGEEAMTSGRGRPRPPPVRQRGGSRSAGASSATRRGRSSGPSRSSLGRRRRPRARLPRLRRRARPRRGPARAATCGRSFVALYRRRSCSSSAACSPSSSSRSRRARGPVGRAAAAGARRSGSSRRSRSPTSSWSS